MTDFMDGNESTEQIEAVILAAGGYVQASEDLRPRVLESARIGYRERRARHWIGHSAFLVLLVALCTATVGGRAQVLSTSAADSRLAADANAVYSLAETKVVLGQVDFGWGMVEAFTDVRRRQAESLRRAL